MPTINSGAKRVWVTKRQLKALKKDVFTHGKAFIHRDVFGLGTRIAPGKMVQLFAADSDEAVKIAKREGTLVEG